MNILNNNLKYKLKVTKIKFIINQIIVVINVTNVIKMILQ
jgi:hypothetical protein